MATVMAVDSQNQAFACFWGMSAFLLYIKDIKHKYLLWPLLIFIATLSKENGLMWAFICPVLAFGFDIIKKRTLRKDLLVAIGICLFYALAIVILPKEINIHPDYVPDDGKVVKNIIKFLFNTFITVDYVSLLHQPSRNILWSALSFILTLPFFYFVFIRSINLYSTKKVICILIAMLIAVAPHVFTVFSMMHTYAALPLLAILVTNIIEHNIINRKPLVLSFLLFTISATAINIHLWKESVKSGLVGENMAKEAINKTAHPVNSVYVIIIEDDYQKLSSFCVVPADAFGWGRGAALQTNFTWPQEIEDTTIERSTDAFKRAKELGLEILNKQHSDCVWIVNHEHIEVIKR